MTDIEFKTVFSFAAGKVNSGKAAWLKWVHQPLDLDQRIQVGELLRIHGEFYLLGIWIEDFERGFFFMWPRENSEKKSEGSYLGVEPTTFRSLVRMRTRKNKTSAPNCESNLRPSDDYFGSGSTFEIWDLRDSREQGHLTRLMWQLSPTTSGDSSAPHHAV